MAIVIAAMLCVGGRNGIVEGFIKLFGVFCSVFISLHYYVRFAHFLKVQFFGNTASTEFLAFCLLAIPIFLIFILISKGWALIIKLKMPVMIDRYGGVILGLAQSYFACGLVFFLLLLSRHNYAAPAARRSVSSTLFRHVAVDLYRASYSVLTKNFFPEEQVNHKALELAERETREE
jgi:uncharacterized membrane protein required for colicin V production